MAFTYTFYTCKERKTKIEKKYQRRNQKTNEVVMCMVAEGCHSEKKQNKQQTNKEKQYVFQKNSVYKKIINKLNLLKLLKKYSEAKLP